MEFIVNRRQTYKHVNGVLRIIIQKHWFFDF